MLRDSFKVSGYIDEDALSQINFGFIEILSKCLSLQDFKMRADYRLDTISAVCTVFKSVYARYKLRLMTTGMFREVFFGGLDNVKMCSIYDMERNAISTQVNEAQSLANVSNTIKKSRIDSITIGQARLVHMHVRDDNSHYASDQFGVWNDDSDKHAFPRQMNYNAKPDTQPKFGLQHAPNLIVQTSSQLENLTGKPGNKVDQAATDNCVLKKDLIITKAEIAEFMTTKGSVCLINPAMERCDSKQQMLSDR